MEIEKNGRIAAAKPEVTKTTKINDRGINDHNTTRKIDMQKGRYNHYSNSKERYSEL